MEIVDSLYNKGSIKSFHQNEIGITSSLIDTELLLLYK